MGFFRFTIGVLGILLLIGVFSSIIPLIFLGGIATGNIIFALGFPIFLIIVSTGMIYFGFYYKDSKINSNYQILDIVKWGAIYTIAILISNFLVSRLMIVNALLITIISAALISIITQVIKSHDSKFEVKWFILELLIYANVIWAFNEFIIPEIFFQTGIFSSIVVGFILAGAISIIRKPNLNTQSIKWLSITLAIILLVANLASLQISTSTPLTTTPSPDNGQIPEDNQLCPTSTLTSSSVSN